MNEFMNALKNETNYGYTENGGVKHNSTMSKVLDMFGMGGSMRNRNEDDILHMFKCAYGEDPELALRCLFYLRDVRGGQGERRFFRIILHWMGNHMVDEVEHLIPMISEYGRWDDLFELFNTKSEPAMLGYVYHTVNKNEDHLIYKWLPSINASSRTTKSRGRKIASEFNMTEREYRKMLTEGRKACNLVESLMSQNHWDQIAFDKLPSRAGLLYKNAFMRREETKARYMEFMSDEKTKVNASVLNPVEIAHQIFNYRGWNRPGSTERQAWQKYWDNLTDYYGGREEPGIAIVDVRQTHQFERAGNIMLFAILIWIGLCFLELFNDSCSMGLDVGKWFAGFRLMAIQLVWILLVFSIYISSPHTLITYLKIWALFSLFSVFWVWKQEVFGFTPTENLWIETRGRSTHILNAGTLIRYFSTFSDAANYGCHAASAAVAFIIFGITNQIKRVRWFFLIISVFVIWGMFQSGTRTAIFCLAAGLILFIVLFITFPPQNTNMLFVF